MKKILIILILFFSLSIQSQTVQEVKDLINSNLASGSKITAEKHREVELAIVSLIENKIFLKKSSVALGNVSTDDQRTITFTSVGTSNYLVAGSLVSNSSNWNVDNDVFWSVKNKTSTQFELLLREISGGTNNLTFNYVIIPY